MNLEIKILPIPMERQRVTKKGKCYTPERSILFRKLFQNKLIKQLPDDWTPTPKNISLDIGVFKNCKSPTSKNYGDVDNLAKAIMDAMNGIVYLDDSQVVSLSIDKCVGDNLIILNIEVVDF